MTDPTLDDYKLVAEAFVDLFTQPMGIESWSPDRIDEVAAGFVQIGHPETAKHLKEGYEHCLRQRVAGSISRHR